MAKYSVEQKTEAVRLYTVMSNEGTCYFNDKAIHNIRALCKALNISSQSLYRWAEEFTDIDIPEEEDIDTNDYTYFAENLMDVGFGLPEIEPMTFKMGTTFFQTLAQGLGIKNYRMPLNQLYLTIGSKLIKLSGLVENGVREKLSENTKVFMDVWLTDGKGGQPNND